MSSSSGGKACFNTGGKARRKKVIRCGCVDVYSVGVAGTENNMGKKFYGCPNYKVEGGNCGFFKWDEEEDDGEKWNIHLFEANQQSKATYMSESSHPSKSTNPYQSQSRQPSKSTKIEQGEIKPMVEEVIVGQMKALVNVGQMKALVEVIVGLLVFILVMLTLMVLKM